MFISLECSFCFLFETNGANAFGAKEEEEEEDEEKQKGKLKNNDNNFSLQIKLHHAQCKKSA